MSLDKILAEYNENSASQKTNIKKQVDLSNYFSTFLPKGVNEATKTIRILPGADGTPFETLYVHTHKVDNRWPKFVCPNHHKKNDNGEAEDCPFCEAHDAFMAMGTEEDRKLAYQYKAKKTYIVKVIDREKEGEGVKFWRFTHSRQKDGIYDKIISLFKFAKADLSDITTGRDLTINIQRNERGIPTVSSVAASFEVTPLSADQAQANLWLNDERTWADVYSVKSYDYLRILVENETPVWDNEQKKYVSKKSQTNESGGDTKDLDSELTIGGNTTTSTPNPTATQGNVAPNPTAQATGPVVGGEDEEEDDLPF
jgi:hypothetical protein